MKYIHGVNISSCYVGMETNSSRESNQECFNVFTNSTNSSLEYIFQVSDLRESSKNIAFLIIILGFGVALRIICNTMKLRFLYYPLVLLGGFFAGLIIHYNEHVDYYNFRLLAEMNPNNYLLIFFPVMLFHTAFSMDYHGFGHSTLQVLFISIVGFPLQAVLLAAILVNINEGWTWEVAITFSIICCVIESEIVYQELNKTQERIKHIQLLLQGEQLATLAIATFSFRVNFEHYYGSTDTLTFLVLTMLWHILGIVFGIVFGYILSYIFISVSNEMPMAVILTMLAAFLSFYIGHIHIYQAGVIATIMTGIMLSPTKLKTTSDAETQLTNYWDWLSFVFNTTAFTIPGVIVGLEPHFITLKHFIYVLVVYIVCCCIRLILFTSTRPLLVKLGHNLTLKNIAIVVIGPYRAAPALIIAMLYRRYSPEDGQQVLTYTAVLCFVSSLLNGGCLPVLLKQLGLYELTEARAVNMRIAIGNVEELRKKTILSLKMDRVVTDANWKIVKESTKLNCRQSKINQVYETETKVPYEYDNRSFSASISEVMAEQHVMLTIKDIELEAKHRILKAQLVSLWRQYETGTLSKSSMRVLSTLLENSMEKEDPVLDVNELELYWSPPKYIKKIKSSLEYILRTLPQEYHSQPTQRIRAAFFNIVNTLPYRLVTTFVMLIDSYFILNLALYQYWPKSATLKLDILQALDFIFYSIFMLEFVILIFALGCTQYFRRIFHKIDFTCNVLIRTCDIIVAIVLYIEDRGLENSTNKEVFVLTHIKLFLLLRLNRLYTIVEVVILKLLQVIDNRLDNTLVKYYEIGKAILVANDRTLKHLRRIVQDKEIYRKLRLLLEEDRRKVAKSMGHIQNERPSVAVTNKTKHAIIQVINEMKDCINDIYDEGLLDEIERKFLKGYIDRAKRYLRSFKVITPCSPEYILKDVPWLFEENETAAFLLEHARLVSYNYQDKIIEAQEDFFGLFVLVSGLVKCIYKPSQLAIENFRKNGALPNCDFLASLKLEESQEDYVVCGNVIGEIGAVTRRPFDMTVVCESAVQVYFIPWLCVFKVLYEMENCTRVFCKIWKSIGIRVALLLLQFVPYFQGWSSEKFLLYLEKSFVPILDGVEELYINELVADVILIEGMVMDGNTKSVFYAPFYIPRTTIKLILPGSSKWKITPVYTTRLLIVPNKPAEEEDIIGPGGIIKEGKEHVGMELHTTEATLVLPQIRRPREQKKMVF